MKNANFFPLICYLAFSATSAHAGEKTDSLFKVLKVKTKGDYFVIHAQRNDSLFKIISKNVSFDTTTGLEKLRKGKSYYFEFGKTDDTIQAATLNGNASNLHVKYSVFFEDRATRIKFEKRFHYRIYFTRNLIGLYYSRSPFQKKDPRSS